MTLCHCVVLSHSVLFSIVSRIWFYKNSKSLCLSVVLRFAIWDFGDVKSTLRMFIIKCLIKCKQFEISIFFLTVWKHLKIKHTSFDIKCKLKPNQ